MEPGDRGLELVRPRSVGGQSGRQHRLTFGDELVVPTGSILILEEDEPAVVVEPGGSARIGEQQQGQQSLHVGPGAGQVVALR